MQVLQVDIRAILRCAGQALTGSRLLMAFTAEVIQSPAASVKLNLTF